jgi:hypothetical protein
MLKPKKTQAQKQLIKFRNQLHNLLIRYPEIRISGNLNGDPIACIHSGEVSLVGDVYHGYEQIYLPTNGKQEKIVN